MLEDEFAGVEPPCPKTFMQTVRRTVIEKFVSPEPRGERILMSGHLTLGFGGVNHAAVPALGGLL